MNFDAVVLAGGKSSRMGCDKAFLEIDGETFLARQIRLSLEAGACECFIAGRAGVDYSPFARPVLHDRFADAGPLTGIEAALAAATSPLVLVIAVDMPEITVATLRQILAACADGKGAVPRIAEKLEPLAAAYPAAARPIAAEMLKQQSLAVRDFAANCVEASLAGYLDFPPSEAHSFRNCNSPGDLTHLYK